MENIPTILTIAIPTWRRPDAVGRRVAELSKQIVQGVHVIIFENGASEETCNALSPYLCERIEYSPSTKNNGIARNLLRCIEEPVSEWIWILGDDDAILPGSIERVMGWIAQGAGYDFITTRPFTEATALVKTVRTPKELFEHTTLSEALFISSTIWRRSTLVPQIETFLESAYTMSSQLCAMIEALSTEGSCAQVRIDSLLDPTTGGHRWSRLRYIRRSTAVIDFTKESFKHEVARAMWSAWLWAAEDSMKEVNSPEKLSEWRSAMWHGLFKFHKYINIRSFIFHAYKSAILSIFLRKRHANWRSRIFKFSQYDFSSTKKPSQELS